MLGNATSMNVLVPVPNMNSRRWTSLFTAAVPSSADRCNCLLNRCTSLGLSMRRQEFGLKPDAEVHDVSVGGALRNAR
jgi:hypothetical protein